MVISALSENTSTSEEIKCEHGLSLYIESHKHNILFDTGASDLFIENAKTMDIDLSNIDIAVISHGHYDHGGGIRGFIKENSKAKLYIQSHAFEQYYAKRGDGNMDYIGLNNQNIPYQRIHFVDDQITIDEELMLISNIEVEKNSKREDDQLYKMTDTIYQLDNFKHEQLLVIQEEDKQVLLTGCSHNGIVNILTHVYQILGKYPNYVIGGFHLINTPEEMVKKIGKELVKTGSIFFTCHCTGMDSYSILKDIMGDQLHYLSAGGQVII